MSIRTNSGKRLNKLWGVGVSHALYHKDGTWFENLERFPGALFDPNGYIRFERRGEYKNNPFIEIGQKTNVRKGISNIPGYIDKR